MGGVDDASTSLRDTWLVGLASGGGGGGGGGSIEPPKSGGGGWEKGSIDRHH